MASSTIGCGVVAGGECVENELEDIEWSIWCLGSSIDEVVNDGVAGLDFVFAGGNISNGLEKVIGLAFISSSSKSLSSSGMGTVVATSKDSSSIILDQLAIDERVVPKWSSRFGGVKGGGSWWEGEGGECGNAVETARLKVGLLGVVDTVEEVVGMRRRTESNECG